MTPYVFCVMGLLLGLAGIKPFGPFLLMISTVLCGFLALMLGPSVAQAVDIAVLVATVGISYFLGVGLRVGLFSTKTVR